MEIKEAIEQLRKEKNDPNKPAFLIYAMLKTAHPTVVEMIEYQAAKVMIAGEMMKNTIVEASKTEEGRDRLNKGMAELLAKYKSPSFNDMNEEEKDG